MSSKKTTSKVSAKASASDKKTEKSTPKTAASEKEKPTKATASTKKADATKEASATAKKTTAKPVKDDKAAAQTKKTVVKKDNPEKSEPAKVAKTNSASTKKPTKGTEEKPAVDTTKKPTSIVKDEPVVEDESTKNSKNPTKTSLKPGKPNGENTDKVKTNDVVTITVDSPADATNGRLDKGDKSGDKKNGTKFDYPYSVLLDGKKPCKFIMFVEIDEQEERANKKKVTSEMKSLEKKPTSAIRHKISLAEETQEELTERILKELEEQNAAFTREAATQICTRCNKNLVSPEFWVDKHLGYCEECAAILHLGQSKEARKVEYQLGAMGGDSLDEVEDDDIEGPDAAALREAEEELADFDD